jgi:hypothetical protein
MSKGREGENLFLHTVVKGATGRNMKTKTGASKVNVSMPKDLFDYLKKCVEEHNARPENAYGPTDFSKMVQKAVREMMKHERKENSEISAQKSSSKASKVQPRVGVVIEPGLETSATGSSTRMKKSSRRTG